MKLIISRWRNQYYAYPESERHHKVTQKIRRENKNRRLNIKVLDEECCLNRVLKHKDYIVVDL